MRREEGVTGSLFVWKRLCIMRRALVSPWFRTGVVYPDTVCPGCSSSQLVVCAWPQSVSPKSTGNLFCSQSTKIKRAYLQAESSTSPTFRIFFYNQIICLTRWLKQREAQGRLCSPPRLSPRRWEASGYCGAAAFIHGQTLTYILHLLPPVCSEIRHHLPLTNHALAAQTHRPFP